MHTDFLSIYILLIKYCAVSDYAGVIKAVLFDIFNSKIELTSRNNCLLSIKICQMIRMFRQSSIICKQIHYIVEGTDRICATVTIIMFIP